jgi:hypothetical protein
MTRQPLSIAHLYPNHAIKALVDDFQARKMAQRQPGEQDIKTDQRQPGEQDMKTVQRQPGEQDIKTVQRQQEGKDRIIAQRQQEEQDRKLAQRQQAEQDRKLAQQQQAEQDRKLAQQQQEEYDRKLAQRQQEEHDRKIAQEYACFEKVSFFKKISVGFFNMFCDFSAKKTNDSDQLHGKVSHSMFPMKMYVSIFLCLSIRNWYSFYELSIKMESVPTSTWPDMK